MKIPDMRQSAPPVEEPDDHTNTIKELGGIAKALRELVAIYERALAGGKVTPSERTAFVQIVNSIFVKVGLNPGLNVHMHFSSDYATDGAILINNTQELIHRLESAITRLSKISPGRYRDISIPTIPGL